MDSGERFASPKAIGQARDLRRNASKAERNLWSRLRAKKLGFKFRRQHPIGDYVADFFCGEAGLVIELDGLSHDFQIEKDVDRTAALESQGLLVVRFRNLEVLKSLDSVVEQIEFHCRQRVEDEGPQS